MSLWPTRTFDHAEDVGIEHDSIGGRCRADARSSEAIASPSETGETQTQSPRDEGPPVSGHVPSGRKASDVVQPLALLDVVGYIRLPCGRDSNRARASVPSNALCETVPVPFVLEGVQSKDSNVTSVPTDQVATDAQPASAVSAMSNADAAVVVVGERAYAEGLGDNPTPVLAADQQSLIAALEATAKPVIIVMIAGRPLGFGPDKIINDAKAPPRPASSF